MPGNCLATSIFIITLCLIGVGFLGMINVHGRFMASRFIAYMAVGCILGYILCCFFAVTRPTPARTSAATGAAVGQETGTEQAEFIELPLYTPPVEQPQRAVVLPSRIEVPSIGRTDKPPSYKSVQLPVSID